MRPGRTRENHQVEAACGSESETNLLSLREVKASMGKVISDKDLELLLDRSDLLGKSCRPPTSCRSNT